MMGFLSAIVPIMIMTGDKNQVDQLLKEPYGLIVPFGLMVGFLALWVRVYEKRLFKTVGFVRINFLRRYLLGFVTGIVMIAISVGLIIISGGATVEKDGIQPQNAMVINGILLLLFCFMVQGAAEEIILRGWFLQVIGVRYTPWKAILYSSVIFCLLHIPAQPIAAVNLILFGLFLAFYCLHEGSIWGVCGWHTAWNWTMMNIFGLKCSGTESLGPTVFNLRTTGYSILTGGEYGPEGSIFTTLIFIAGIYVISKRIRDKSTHGY